MKTLKEFLSEYRLMASDTWGDATEAWFECAGQMYKRSLSIPTKWQYRPGLGGDGTDTESYWFELFENTSDEVLLTIGKFLFRYCELLERNGKSY